MKSIASLVLLAILSASCSVPALAWDRNSYEQQARASRKEQKGQNKYAKQQMKAMKKSAKAQRKALKRARKRGA